MGWCGLRAKGLNTKLPKHGQESHSSTCHFLISKLWTSTNPAVLQGARRVPPKAETWWPQRRDNTGSSAPILWQLHCPWKPHQKHWQIRLETSPSLYFCDRCKWITQLNSRLTAKICPVLRSSSGPYLLENPKSAQHSWLMIQRSVEFWESPAFKK